MSEQITFKTSDGIKIAGTYNPGTANLGIILIHMMPATRGSYDQLAAKFNEQGWHTLAIDLRGHGESAGGDYQIFTDEQHQQSILDLEAAYDWLSKKVKVIGLLGASIGANLTIRYASLHQVEFVVALSAGIAYRGIQAIDDVPKVKYPIIFMATKDDVRTEGPADQQALLLWEKTLSNEKSIKIYDTGGHGTDMLQGDLERQKFLINWIMQILWS
jgi:dienelactone hydrolase